MITYFKNLIVELYIFYVLNTYVKFYDNRMLFTIRFINLFFMYNFRLQKLEIKHLIDDIVIDHLEIL